MSRIGTIVAAAALFSATLVASSSTLSAQTTAPAGDAAHGKQLYDVNGCYLCHNYQGQGTGSRRPAQNPGPNLAPGPIPWVAFVKQLRTPRVSMPPYDTHLLSDKDLADIYAYLASQPASKDPHSIALLETVSTGTTSAAAGGAALSPLARGAEIFATNCAACHGASGGGGAGPSLKNESARKDTAAAIAFIKNPPPAMPKLYPSVLKDADVAAVAAYVESLH